jgi:2-amino-4-hydroxy-6-hydroxymethyldihydropteridine diphosphokinase
LSLGSNIDPETNLARAVEHLGAHGAVEAVSSVWESHAIGSVGPNFLNACVSFLGAMGHAELKREITTAIEDKMGRVRGRDRLAPRTIDIDILMADSRPVNLPLWSHAFVLLPLAELLPDFSHPAYHRPLLDLGQEIQARTWIVRRAESLSPLPPLRAAGG